MQSQQVTDQTSLSDIQDTVQKEPVVLATNSTYETEKNASDATIQKPDASENDTSTEQIELGIKWLHHDLVQIQLLYQHLERDPVLTELVMVTTQESLKKKDHINIQKKFHN